MKGYIFLVVNLALSSTFSQKQQQQNGMEMVDIGEDQDITEANRDLLYDDILERPNTQRSAIIDERRLWTSPVPYLLDNDLEMNAKGVILKALDQFRLKTCIDFKPRDSEEIYISVQKLDGCFSYIGRNTQPGGQNLSIGAFCDHVAIVEHEFLHAFGFYHEQSRNDRDDYVTILFENIQPGKEPNFKISNEITTTHGVPYDYSSVMHYDKNTFSKGTGPTIITKDPKFQNVIGQRREVSPSDVLELNLLYKCNTTIASKMYCDFSNGSMCEMNQCSKGGSSWEMVTNVVAGPKSDHTNLPSGGDSGGDTGYFMYASTASAQEGDSAWLQTQEMRPNRKCHVQCLQFYYYHSGNGSDQLNIWIREFQDKQDSSGTRRLMGQITGSPTSYWQLKHVSLNATKTFKVEFEVRKGAGDSSGGFLIDNINLSEIECPHVTMQIDDFENILKTRQILASPRHYSSGGYAYRFLIQPNNGTVGVFMQLLSGENDDKLVWPCQQRQVTFKILDQKPNLQLQMSKQRSYTTDLRQISNGTYLWGNPRERGNQIVDAYGETFFAGTAYGFGGFTDSEEIKSSDFLKGGSAVFSFSFQDLSPLVQGNTLPCPKVETVVIKHAPGDNGTCSSRFLTTRPPTTTTSPPPTRPSTATTSQAPTRPPTTTTSPPPTRPSTATTSQAPTRPPTTTTSP
uniref:Metalloendopeptidase n=1 Tax=Gasterosteus aculeatus aculeatus TaxID=481459 RepID=G3NGM1_GASAC